MLALPDTAACIAATLQNVFFLVKALLPSAQGRAGGAQQALWGCSPAHVEHAGHADELTFPSNAAILPSRKGI
jgi:hypothetical protein